MGAAKKKGMLALDLDGTAVCDDYHGHADA